MQWITALNIDVIKCTLTLIATDDPERGTPTVKYFFRSVSTIHVDRYHDPTENVLGDFRGIEEKRVDDGRSEFRVDTGDGFVIFQAASDFETVPPDHPILIKTGGARPTP